MKRLIFVLFATLMAASALYAWEYTCHSTYRNGQHVPGSTSFTPGSTTAYVRVDAPDRYQTCPVCDTQQGIYEDYYACAKLANGPSSILASKRCGGCATNSGFVTTTETWTLYAYIDDHCYHWPQNPDWGPVYARAASTEALCMPTRPGGE